MIYLPKDQVEYIQNKIQEIVIQDKINNWYKQEWFKDWLERAGVKIEKDRFEYKSPVIINIKV